MAFVIFSRPAFFLLSDQIEVDFLYFSKDKYQELFFWASYLETIIFAIP